MADLPGYKIKRDQPERRIQLAILQYLRIKGYAAGKIKTTGARKGQAFIFDPYQFRGIPDLLVFSKDEMAFIEVKAPGNGQTPEQKDFEQLCLKAHVRYILATSLDDVMFYFP